jgi:hypothetical protein
MRKPSPAHRPNLDASTHILVRTKGCLIKVAKDALLASRLVPRFSPPIRLHPTRRRKLSVCRETPTRGLRCLMLMIEWGASGVVPMFTKASGQPSAIRV